MNNYRRLQRIERLIHKEINKLFHVYTKQMIHPVILSATRIHISSNLNLAKIFLSIYPSEKSAELIKVLQHNKNILRYNLGQYIGKQISHIPELSFFVDDSIDYAERINYLLSFN